MCVGGLSPVSLYQYEQLYLPGAIVKTPKTKKKQ